LVSLVPVARVGDILLLKTSLPRPGRTTGAPTGTNLLQYNGTAPQHATQARCLGSGRFGHIRGFALPHCHKQQAIAPAEALSAPDWAQQEQRQEVFFNKSAAPRAVSKKATAVGTCKWSGEHGRHTPSVEPSSLMMPANPNAAQKLRILLKTRVLGVPDGLGCGLHL
jgi:hypothetical protein